MADINDILSQANSATHRSAWQATNPGFGQSEPALATMNGSELPPNTDPRVMQAQQMQPGAMQMGQAPMQAMPMMDTLDMLKEMAEPKEKEVSLKTLTKKQKEKIMDSFKRCRKIADDHYKSVIEPEIQRRRDIYNADVEMYRKKFPKLSESTDWVSKDVMTTCDWLLPGLVEAFTGSDEPLSVKGTNANDDETAKTVQELVRYQLEKKNDYFTFAQNILKTALSENWAVSKIWWKRDEKRERMEMMVDAADENTFVALLDNAVKGKIELVEISNIPDAPDFIKVAYDEVTVKANHPIVEFLPSSEFRFTPDSASIQDCKFVAHRKIVHGDYLKRKELEGVYENVDKAIEEYNAGEVEFTSLDKDNDLDRTQKKNRPDDNDKASKELELYEAYIKVDYNNDGVYEDLIVHAVGDIPIRIVENDISMPLFLICQAISSPTAVFNRSSFSDLFVQLQDLKTAVVRQMIINIAKNNDPRLFVNETMVDMDALLSGEEIIPTRNSPGESIFNPPALQMSSMTMELVNYAQSELEAQSGSTRYNQGLDSNSLNKTATGITSIMGASEKRAKLMARSIAESFFIPLYRLVILLNQKYLEDEQMIRLTDKSVSIRREDLDIDYDLIINVGQGAGTKEAQIQYLMYVLQSIYPVLAQQGIVNAKSWYNLVIKLLEQLGLRDVGQYLLDPESEQAQQQAQQAQQAAAQAQAEALQNSLQLSIAKSSVPRISVNLTDLPADFQQKFLLNKFGIETSERAIEEHEVLIKQ